jgi:hypothetical protein
MSQPEPTLYGNPERIKERIPGSAATQVTPEGMKRANEYGKVVVDLESGHEWTGTIDTNNNFISTEPYGYAIPALSEQISASYIRYDFNEMEAKSDQEFINAVNILHTLRATYTELGLLVTGGNTTVGTRSITYPSNPNGVYISGLSRKRHRGSEFETI